MSNCRKRGNGYTVLGRWISPYKMHLYYGVKICTERGFVYPGDGGIMVKSTKRKAK